MTRDAWREACGLGVGDFLIAANFFLFNVVEGGDNVIPVDELVRCAVSEPHSAAFDRLGLFVVHLSLGGRRRGTNGIEFPSAWANEFARESLWRDGRWRRDALDEAAMDAFLAGRIQGVPDARRKSRSNYRHLFELTRYLPATADAIHADAEDWAASALFTAWDRRALSAAVAPPLPAAGALVAASLAEQDHKLLGLTEEEFAALAPPIAEQYAAAGGLSRFRAVAPPPARAAPPPPAPGAAPVRVRGAGAPPRASRPPPAPPAGGAAEDLGWLTRAAADGAVERQVAQRLAQVRDRVQALRLKALYGHRCMACGQALLVGFDPDRHYVEAAHIKPLGFPHNGPDHPGNMLVLCPNHHLQFDRGVLSVRTTGAGPSFTSRVPGDPIHGTPVALRAPHALDAECVAWHQEFFGGI